MLTSRIARARRPGSLAHGHLASWRVRDLHDDDPDRVVRVWEHSRKTSVDPVAEVAQILAAIEVTGRPSSLWSGRWSSA